MDFEKKFNIFMEDKKKKKEKKRGWAGHLIHAIGHKINKSLKENGKPGIEESNTYKEYSPDKANQGPWPKEEDQNRMDYHLNKFNQEMEKMMDRDPF